MINYIIDWIALNIKSITQLNPASISIRTFEVSDDFSLCSFNRYFFIKEFQPEEKNHGSEANKFISTRVLL